MSAPSPAAPGEDSSVGARAVSLLTAQHSGHWSRADQQLLERWLSADPAHAEAYRRVEAVWAATGCRGDYAAVRAPAVGKPRRRAGVPLAAAVATCGVVLGAVVLGARWQHWRDGVAVAYRTAVGERRTVALDDGSTVVADGDSAFTVRLGGRSRVIVLSRGELYLDVRHDATRPFVVQAGAGEIEDLGTRFDVELTGSGARVAVMEGEVSLKTVAARTRLGAAEAAVFDTRGRVEALPGGAATADSWRSGLRRFDNEPLTAVLERVRRYHDVTFDIDDPSLQRLRLSGVFRLQDLDNFLNALSAVAAVSATTTAPGHIAIRARPAATP